MNDKLITKFHFKNYEWREFLEQLNDEDAHLFYSLFAKTLLGVTE